MFEELISVLDNLGVTYDEDYETGTLTIDITEVDKDSLVDIINSILGTDMDYTIDASTVVVTGETTDIDEATTEDTGEEDYSSLSDTALDDYLG